MKTNRRLPRHFLCWLLTTLVLVSACRSSKQTVAPERADLSDARHYVETVISRMPTVDCLNAKMRLVLTVGNKRMSVGGNLRMKKDEVIQLSLVGLGIIEGGRMEFTPDSVLLLDRLNRRYVSARYDELSFLREANIDFYTLQALFWNQLVLPDVRQVTLADADAFDLQRTSQEAILTGSGNRALTYTFYTSPQEATLDHTSIVARRASTSYCMDWIYDRFVTLDADRSERFPSQLDVSLTGLKQSAALSISLTRLSADDNWNKRTQVSSRYRRVSVDDLLKILLNL